MACVFAGAMVLSLSTGISAAEYSPRSPAFAAFKSGGRHGCLAAGATKLAIGQPIALVQLEEGQNVVSGVITSKRLKSCPEFKPTELEGPFYLYKLNRANIKKGAFGIAVLEPSVTFETVKGRAVATFPGSPAPYYFYKCTSNEGLHGVVWAGTHPKAKMVWHEALYLGYDVEPSCTESDGAAMEMLAK
jgi:hypothetical protein